MKSRDRCLVAHLTLLPQSIPALFLTSLIQTTEHRTVAVAVVFSRLSNVSVLRNRTRNQVKYYCLSSCFGWWWWFLVYLFCFSIVIYKARNASSVRFPFNTSNVTLTVKGYVKHQALVYDTAIVDYAIGLEKLSANEQFLDDAQMAVRL